MGIDLFDEIVRTRREGLKAALATIVQIQGAVPSFRTDKMLVREDGSTLGSVGGGAFEAEVWAAAREVIQQETSRLLTFDNAEDSMRLEVFLEPLLPAPRVVIFGAGHISLQLSKIATVAGFTSWIVDDRPIHASTTRFPEAERIFSGTFEEAFSDINPDANTYIVILTRENEQDAKVLRWAIESNARYVGMIGGSTKVERLARLLGREGNGADRFEHVHMPIGLDIGAIAPEEIAVSIVAEMIHYRRRGFDHSQSKKGLSRATQPTTSSIEPPGSAMPAF